MTPRLDGRFWVWPDGTRILEICGGGGGTETTQAQVQPKTPEEEALLSAQAELLNLQIQDIQRQNDMLAQVFPDQQSLLVAQTQAALEQVDLFHQLVVAGTPTADEQTIRDLSNKKAIALLTGQAPQISPEQQANLDRIYGTASEHGTAELTRFAQDLATSRGMRPGDSPISDEALRQERMLQENLGSAKATATLNYGQAQQAFDETVRQFQEGLRVQSYQNRLALLGRSPSPQQPMFSTGVGTTSALSALNPALATFQQGRNTGQSQSFDPGAFNYLSAATSAASLPLYAYLSRAAAPAAAAAFTGAP